MLNARRRKLLALLFAIGLSALSQATWAVRADEASDFFEARVRPVLVNACYDCHTDAAKGGLRVDSREALLNGGQRGPAIVLGKADESLLVKAVSHVEAALKMPKGGAKLKDAEIADLKRWINDGAPWPAGKPTADYTLKAEQKSFWSLQTVRQPAVPTTKTKSGNPIDAFLLAQLVAKGLGFNPPADRRTLIRRATYDLTGLPPKPEEIAAFLTDQSPTAFARVVDRLLNSAAYGERWGRHWLDLARYSDTLGPQDFIQGIQTWFPYSYTYRDWVIRALNEDLPYDQFIKQQLAADRIAGNDPRNLAALGFLTLSRGGLGVSKEDRIDDKIDVVARGLLGLTVSCARCHNHKFDPIPTSDYYALYSVFANTREPKILPLLDPRAAASDKQEIALQAEIKGIEDDIAKFRAERFPALLAAQRAPEEIAKNLLAVHQARGMEKETELKKLAEDHDYNVYLIRRWRAYFDRHQNDPVWAIWSALTALPEKEFAERAAATIAAVKDSPALVREAFSQEVGKTAPASLRDAAKTYGKLIAAYDTDAALPDAQQEALRLVVRGADSPTAVPFADFGQIRLVKDSQTERDKEKKIETLLLKHAYRQTAPRAMALEDNPELQPGYIFVRGNPANRGARVERQFLLALAGEERQPFKQGSGRLELAEAIACKENPLTARVAVNRIWQYHFGAGLVRTPSDFGARGDRPTHPELLDYLAAQFVGRWLVDEEAAPHVDAFASLSTKQRGQSGGTRGRSRKSVAVATQSAAFGL